MSKQQNSWDGDFYKKHSSIQYQVAMRVVDAHNFRGNETILDIGSGDGKVTYEIAKRVPEGSVLGLDFSSKMCDFATQTFAHISNLKFIIGDAQALTFSQQFDLITSFCCLHWPEDKLAIFKGIHASLKPGGIALLVIPQGVDALSQAIDDAMALTKWCDYFEGYQNPTEMVFDDDYEQYAKLAGFVIENFHIEQTKNEFPDHEALQAWITAVTPHRMQLPEDQRDEFMNEIVNRYLDYVGDKNRVAFDCGFFHLYLKK